MSFKKLVKKAKDNGFLLLEETEDVGRVYILQNKTFERDSRSFNTLEEVEAELEEIENSY